MEKNINSRSMDSNKWITVMNKKSQFRRKEDGIDTRSRLRTAGKYADDDPENMKKMLCNNILVFGECHYGDKCMYAHSLDEQNVDPLRKKAYDMIMGDDILEYCDKDLTKILLQLTKVCESCLKNKCPGGYNCKYGVFDKKYQLCSDDLRYGICYNTSCNNIHLTNKGFVPLHQNHHTDIRVVKHVDKTDNNIHIPDGKLLSDNFFMNLKKRHDSDDDDSIGESIESMKEYLNEHSDTDKSCNESIFD